MADPVISGLILNGWPIILVIGAAGGSFLEVLKWWKLRDNDTFDTYKKSPKYWLITIVMVLCGGGWAVMNGVMNVNAIQVLFLGASAPLSFAGLGNVVSSFGPQQPSPTPAPAKAVNPPVGSVKKFLMWQ